jgi:WD40 repeat protein
MHLAYRSILTCWFLLLCSCAPLPQTPSLRLSGVALTLERPAEEIVAMSLAQHGDRLLALSGPATTGDGAVSSARGATLHLWDLGLGRRLRAIPLDGLALSATAAISPDGTKALVGGKAKKGASSLELWDLDQGTRVRSFPNLDKELTTVAFSPDGHTLMAGHGTYIYLFDAASGEFLRQFDTGHTSSLPGQPKAVHAVFTPDGSYIVSGGPDASVKMWDVNTTEKVQHWAGHTRSLQGGITGIAVSSDSSFIFTSSAGDGLVRRWNVADGRVLATYSGNEALWQGVWGTALSPDDRLGFVLSTTPAIYDLETGKLVARLTGGPAGSGGTTPSTLATGIFDRSGKSLFLPMAGAGIKVYDTVTGRERATLTSFTDGEWLAITAEGYFNGLPRGPRDLAIESGGRRLALERLFDPFFRPDVVIATLHGEETRPIAPLTLAEAVSSPPPTVSFTSVPGDADGTAAKVCYQASGPGGIGEVRLYHNGKLIVSDGYYRDIVKTPPINIPLMAMNGSAIHERMSQVWSNTTGNPMPLVSHEKGNHFSDCKEIDPVAGENELSLAAFNKGNTLQSPAVTTRFHAAKAPTPHLYILTIGINKYRERAVNLRFAAKDAASVRARLAERAAGLFSPAAVHHETLDNERAGKAAIIKKINELSRIVNPHDSFVLYFAGHGVLLQDQYYLLTHDYDGNLAENTLLSSNELVDISKKIKALRQFVIIDSCHAGGTDDIVGSLYEARLGVLARKMGVHLLTAAGSVQEALDGYGKNGLFAHALLNGMGGSVTGVEDLVRRTLETSASLRDKTGVTQVPLFFPYGRDFPLFRAE